jgi:MFS family permease
VLVTGIAGETAALVLFLQADDVPMLLLARLLQGAATGMALPALGASLVDFNPLHAPGSAATVNGVVPVGGLALGSLACGALVQHGPTRLIWALLLAPLARALAAVLAPPDT